MSSVDGRRFVKAGSDEINNCDPCKSEGRQREADSLCHQCQEFLCTQCKDHHKKFKFSRDHKVVNLSKIYDCNPCETEGLNREANHYCETCKEYFCNSCSNQHKKFKMSKDHKLRTVSTASQSSMSESKQTSPSDGSSELSLSQHTAPSDGLSELSLSQHTAPSGGLSKLSLSQHTAPSDGLSKLSLSQHTAPSDDDSSSQSFTMATGPCDTNPLDNVLNLKVKLSSKVNINLPQDTEKPRISSCAFLPNGELLLVDCRNRCLKLLDRTLIVKDSFDLLSNRPWDVSVLGANTVVATFPDEKKLEFIQVSPSFSRGSSVPFRKKCWGMSMAVDKIYVGCHDNDFKEKEEDHTRGEVCVIDIQGKSVMKFDTRLRFIKPYYVAANTEGSRIYVSDMWIGITALTATGDILFQYKCNPGYLWGISAMYVDSQSNILVCGLTTHNVQIITAAGNKYNNLLISSDGLKYPLGIAYRPSDGTLVVGCAEQDELCVFKLG